MCKKRNSIHFLIMTGYFLRSGVLILDVLGWKLQCIVHETLTPTIQHPDLYLPSNQEGSRISLRRVAKVCGGGEVGGQTTILLSRRIPLWHTDFACLQCRSKLK